MANPQTLSEKCIDACDTCAMECNGSAFQGEMMGGMEVAARLGRVCSDACSSHASRLKRNDCSESDACLVACMKFIPEAEAAFRHLASFQESAVAARNVITLIGEMSREELVTK